MNPETPHPGAAKSAHRFKPILTALGGVVIAVLVLWAVGAPIYRHYLGGLVQVTQPSTTSTRPVSNIQFWVEQELERVGNNSHLAGAESEVVFTALFKHLHRCGVVQADPLTTLTPSAVRRLTELSAWAGKERDAWKAAAAAQAAYLLKAELVNVSFKHNQLRTAEFRYSLYDMKDKSLLWRAVASRDASFFAGRSPDVDKLADAVVDAMVGSGWLPSKCRTGDLQ